jgi:ABC-type multidrug transport system ATPase subunit
LQISVKNLTKLYGKLHALDNISLEIGSGQVVSLLGLNGAGKTTLLRCMSTVARQDDGEILFDGRPLSRGELDLRKRFFFLPDFPAVFGDMTVAQHIGMVLRLYDKESSVSTDKIVKTLKDLDMLTLVDTKLSKLSRGQVYKAALTALLAVDAELWLVDEPFASGMDPIGLSYFKKQAREAAKRGRTILYSTQILEIAEGFCDRVCVIDHGGLRLFDTMEGLRRYAQDPGNVLEEVFSKMREGSLA